MESRKMVQQDNILRNAGCALVCKQSLMQSSAVDRKRTGSMRRCVGSSGYGATLTSII